MAAWDSRYNINLGLLLPFSWTLISLISSAKGERVCNVHRAHDLCVLIALSASVLWVRCLIHATIRDKVPFSPTVQKRHNFPISLVRNSWILLYWTVFIGVELKKYYMIVKIRWHFFEISSHYFSLIRIKKQYTHNLLTGIYRYTELKLKSHETILLLCNVL